MIELLFLFLSVVILGGWIVIVLVTITIADVRTVTLEKALHAQPHARKWRGVTSLRKKLSYRQDDRFVDPKTIRFALARFQSDPKLRFVEIIPRLEFPQTMQQFFAAYHTIALAPFIKVRAVLNTRSDGQLWQLFSRKRIKMNTQEKFYAAAKWVVSIVNLALLLYVSNIAFILDQPDYLMAYMTAFGLWLAWSITNHPLLVWRQKIAYLVLAPASFAYFMWRAFAAPFVPLRHVPLRPILRRVLS